MTKRAINTDKILNSLLIVLLLIGCVNSKRSSNNEYFLLATDCDYSSEIRYVRIDSVLSNNLYYIKEEIYIDNNINPRYLFKSFEKRLNNQVLKMNIVKDFENRIIDSTYIQYLTLKNDTCILYYFDLNKYPLTIPPSSTDYIFINHYLKEYNLFVMIQEPIGISPYRMIYFYNKNFKIYKVIYEVTNRTTKLAKTSYFEFLLNDLDELNVNSKDYLMKKSYPSILKIIENDDCIIMKKKEYNELIGIHIKI
ncbi:MAG: hypothetical protein HY951_02435 [Bacteroidia bacterium]|nr:hypothetical protein [Bacteroidia bacterium]